VRDVGEFESLFRQIDHLMDRVFDREHFGYLHYGRWEPPMDVYETEDRFVLLLDVSGVQMEDINVTFHEGVLTIRGMRRDLSPPDKVRCNRIEMGHGPFRRRISIGNEVDGEAIEAHTKDGLLRIEIPRQK